MKRIDKLSLAFKNKKICTAVLVLILLFAFSFSVSADEGSDVSMPDEYNNVIDRLPDELKDSLPEGMLDSESVGESIGEVVSTKYLLESIGKMFSTGFFSAVRLLFLLFGLIVISAVIRQLMSSVQSGTLNSSFRLCSSCAIFATVIGVQTSQLYRAKELLESLNVLMESMIPITAIVWAMGGNVSTASTGSATLYVFLSICEKLCVNTVMPICLVLTATALCSAVSPDIKIGSVSGAVKKSYNFVLGFVMSLLVAVLSIQSTLAGAADGLGARAAKLVSSTVIPVVGGSVGDTLRSVAGGVEYIKSVFGISAIIFIAFLILPTLISVILTRLAFIISGGFADILGCDSESRLLSEMSNIYGCMIGVLSMSSVMFILGLAVFVKSSVAMA